MKGFYIAPVALALALAVSTPGVASAARHRRQNTPSVMVSGNHPPNTRGLHPVDAAVVDADDAIALIHETRGITDDLGKRIDTDSQTLTNIATLIDSIKKNHDQMQMEYDQRAQGTTPPAPK